MFKMILLLAGCAMAQQAYTNADFNAKYTAPAGWVFDPPTTIPNGSILIKPNRVGLNPAQCDVLFTKHTTETEAYQYPSSNGFFHTNSFMNVTRTLSTQAPIIFNIRDTTEPNVHFCYIILKQVDAGVIMAYFSTSNRIWSQQFKLVTTISDWNVNENLYISNWMGMGFISETGPTAAKISAAPTQSGKLRRELVDLLGRESFTMAPGSAIFKR
jgi:hypothetical protein